MVDWYDPSAWQGAVKALAALVKLRDSLRRKKLTRPDGAVTRADDAALREQIAALTKTLGQVLEILIRAQENEAEAINALFGAAKAHERRLAALEKVTVARKPRRKRRKGTKRRK